MLLAGIIAVVTVLCVMEARCWLRHGECAVMNWEK
jgi:hypothetical protein